MANMTAYRRLAIAILGLDIDTQSASNSGVG
jgi:hypothetical protein